MITIHPDPSETTDHELVRLAQRELPSRSDSFEALVRRYEPRVLARSRRILGCGTAAQDASQEVFLSVLGSLPRYVPNRPFQHWLDVVTTNACRGVLRKRAREHPVQDPTELERQPADWVAPDPLLRATLDRHLATLRPATREAIRLRYSEGHGYDEIARRLGLKPSTVRMRLIRARDGLRRATGAGESPACVESPERPPEPVAGPAQHCADRLEYHGVDGSEAALRLLYIEDDPVAAEFVARGLSGRGFLVDVAVTAEQGRVRAGEGDYDVLVLDVMLPDIKGFELLQQLRESGIDTPAIFLSSRGEVADRLRGFETGADDYLPKPFALSELAARVQALARRSLGTTADLTLRVSDLELDLKAHRAVRAGQKIELPPKAFALLELLMSRAGRVVTRDELVEKLWGPDAEPRSNALDVQINHLRRRVDHPFPDKLIHTKPGLGYLIEEPDADD